MTVSTKLYLRDAPNIRIYIWVNWLYIFLRTSRICAMRYGRNQHRSDINIHYIPNDPRSTSSPASRPACFPSSSSSSSVRFRSNGVSADHFVIYGESLASRLSDEARYRDSWRLCPSVLHILPPLPPRPPSSQGDRPSRFPLSLFPSFARISSNRHPRW